MKGIGNEGGWWEGPIYTQFIYILCKSWQVGILRSNLIALKIYIFMRGDLIKTKVMDKGHECFLLLKIFFVCIKMLL